MRSLMILFLAVCIVITAMDVATFIRQSTDDRPNDAFVALTEFPPRTIADPKTNGYFVLLGFSVGPTGDPLQTGFDVWVEAESDRGHLYYDYLKPDRVRAHLGGEVLEALRGWHGADPVAELRRVSDLDDARGRDLPALVERYQRWLAMAFEDWGYGHLGSPRFAEMFLTHRLYVASGFSESFGRGVEYVARDLYVWRSVLARAKSLPLKLMAAVVVDDDAQLVAALLSRDNLDPASANRLTLLAKPLTQSERSLRWPVQNEFLTAVTRYDRASSRHMPGTLEDAEGNKRWLATLAGLHPDAFRQVEHPLSANALARGPFQRQRANNTYARYYEATIIAADSPHARLPKLKDFIGGPARAFFDFLINPVDNIFDHGFEPDWQPFLDRILETDARLRLLTLQTRLRDVTDPAAVPARVAEAGDDLSDPFSTLPMLWDARTRTLYSVGRDRKDNDGHSHKDVAVQFKVASPASTQQKAATPPSRL